jgi:outer membrane lipoprotein LolB
VETPAARQAALAKVKFWREEGEFSIREIGKPREFANYVWDEYNKKSYRIAITSVLGLYRVEIYYQFNTVKLWKNGTHVYTAKTPEGLMQKALGWALPVDEMKYWIKGVPAENAGHYVAQYDVYGHLTSLVQDGWAVSFGKYKKNVNGIDFPGAITMQWGKYRVKIAISRYMQPYKLPDAL